MNIWGGIWSWSMLFLWLDLGWVLSSGGNLQSCNGRFGLFVSACLYLLPYKFPSLAILDTKGPFVMCHLCLLKVWRGCHEGRCYPFPPIVGGWCDWLNLRGLRGANHCVAKGWTGMFTGGQIHLLLVLFTELPWTAIGHTLQHTQESAREREREMETGLKKYSQDRLWQA